MSFFKKLFGQKENVEKELISFPDNAHNMWEDDYLMVEFVPKENLAFLQSETKRIQDHGQENFNGHGFTAITPIGEKDVKIFDRAYDFESIVQIILDSGLSRIDAFVYQGSELLTGDEAPIGFGTKQFAIMCEEKNGVLQNLWLSGSTKTAEETTQLVTSICAIGQLYDLVLVNWGNSTYVDTSNADSVQDFIENLS